MAFGIGAPVLHSWEKLRQARKGEFEPPFGSKSIRNWLASPRKRGFSKLCSTECHDMLKTAYRSGTFDLAMFAARRLACNSAIDNRSFAADRQQ
jgi:hypothetical protein